MRIVKIGDPNLSNEYTQVKYIETSGTQYLDTGVLCTTMDYSIEMDIIQIGVGYLFGWRHNNAATGTWISPNITSSNNVRYYYKNYNSSTSLIALPTSPYTLKIDMATGVYIDGVKQATCVTSAGIDSISSVSLKFFGAYDFYDSKVGGQLSGQFGQIRILKGTQLVRHLIPVKKNSNNEFGMYDLVTKTFYGNAGTGSFTGGGPVIDPMTIDTYYGDIAIPMVPAEYDCVEYIQSSGTQYIDTGIPSNNTAKYFDIEFARTTSSTSTGVVISTGRGGTPTISNRFLISSKIQFQGISDGGTITDTETIVTNQKYHCISKFGKVSFDGREQEAEIAVCPSAASIVLFTSRSSTGSAEYFFTGRIYSAKISDGTGLLADFIPVKKKSNNEYGMYDLISKQFFSNRGTGSFTGGSVISGLNHYMLANGGNT